MATLRILITVEWARKAYGLIRYALSKKKNTHTHTKHSGFKLEAHKRMARVCCWEGNLLTLRYLL